jgi:hypothetical protein
MKVLWYKATSESYESGTGKDFQYKQSTTTHPEEILALERFYDTPSATLRKIAMELNKCRLGRQR